MNFKLKRKLHSALLIFVLVYLGFGALLNIYQYSFIYFPTEEIIDDTYHYTAIRSGNVTLKLWVINPDKKQAVIYFGGNASNVYNAIPQLDLLSKTKTIYLVNYRGYGGSTGMPSEKGLSFDALNVYDFVKANHASVSVIGRSLGTGIATYLAASRDLDKLVLVTPYDSIEAVAQERYPIYPISYLLKDKFDSLSKVDSISESTLILIAETDNIVPTRHAHKLAAAFKSSQLTTITLASTTHNTIASHPLYQTTIADFIE